MSAAAGAEKNGDVSETCIPPIHEPRNLLQHRSSPKEAREMSTFLVAESLSEGTESEEYG